MSQVRFEGVLTDRPGLSDEKGEPIELDQESESDQHSLFSIDRASTAPTEAEIAVTNIEDIIEAFLGLIFGNMDCLESIALATKRYSTYVLERRLRLLLKQFVTTLRLDSDASDRNMISFFRGRSIIISRMIVERVEAKFGQLPSISKTDDSTSAVRARDEDDGLDLNVGGRDNESDDNDDSIVAAEIDVPGFQHLISSSPAFHKFLREISDISFPSFKSIVKSLLSRWRRKQLELPVEQLLSELIYSEPDLITVTEERPSWSDVIKGLIETYTHEQWNWWPLRPPHTPLEPDQVRVTWRCVSSSVH